MPLNSVKQRLDIVFFIIAFTAYLGGQFLIGTYSVGTAQFLLSAPSDADFLYYAGIIKQMQIAFPPQNPAFGGIVLGQSFFQYYPVALLSILVNVYYSMKIFNLLYLVLFATILRRYFPTGWGVGLIIITAGAVGSHITNSLGIDLVARGFNHFPFFILALIGLFEKKRSVRLVALFFLPLVHSFLALLFILGLILFLLARKFDRKLMPDILFCGLGFVSAILLMWGGTDKSLIELLTSSFGISLEFIWAHGLVAAVVIIGARDLRITLLAIASFLFGVLFHYYSFFPVFMINFLGGLAAMKIYSRSGKLAYLSVATAVILLIGFSFAMVNKYNPTAGDYYPHPDSSYKNAAKWLDKYTPGDAIILTIPIGRDWDCRIMEVRALYLGLVQHVVNLGVEWEARGQLISAYYHNPSGTRISADYVIFGPNEKRLFPDFRISREPSYKDKEVTIWKINPPYEIR